ncbi:M10 family metallopeptidase C-terminal domain-containing protein [Rhodobacter sp. KR11]|uniref:M10 family metallopeptidase C-terminal domain-containing protein n=1 Tax=Rhodobacter sp. KR11 TaxID=2974588 RepID=UPI0022216033|nr:M10 family metallopeptidase C-terminal domain-containing protein [Rhodobacter sp. KR11]MCW1920491.1 M10 family metallopeptidase C-terminal domain-containing protein [Rhodobacter sp. KR11]
MAVLFESADAADGLSTTYAMAVGDVFRGSLGTGQSDWVRISLVAGQSYAFAVMGLGALGLGLVDARLVLRDASGAALFGDEDGGPGLSALFTYVPPRGGSYFLEVISHQSGATGAYAASVVVGTMASLAPEAAAGALLREGGSWAAAPAQAATVTWGYVTAGPAYDASGDRAQFATLTAAQKTAVVQVLNAYAEVSGVRFQQVAGAEATIRIGAYWSQTDGAGAYANLPGSRAAASEDGDVWLNNDSISQTALPRGSYAHFAILHEMGHALGLDHPGDYNAAPGEVITYRTHAQYAQDSTQYTVMSYFDAWATEPNAPRKMPDTLMMHDILALQRLYGASYAARAGNSTYGFNATMGGPYDFAVNKAPLLCIWDGAGVDTIDLSGFSQAQKIDLTAGRFSDVGGYRGNLSIALGVSIEHAVGGAGADLILGNGLANRLTGKQGDDTLDGGIGNDTLTGGLGADRFVFDKGDGSDWVTDFDNALDVLALDADLWGGAALGHAEIVAQFALLRAGHVVLDFGVQELHVLGLTSVFGLEGHIVTRFG